MKRKLRVTVDGVSYDVEVEVLDGDKKAPSGGGGGVPVARAAAEPAPVAATPAPQAAAGAGDVTSPLAGRVVEIAAKVGQDVKEGDQLLTLEAMKMNTFVFATHDGKVAEILIAPGDAVEEGQALIKLG